MAQVHPAESSSAQWRRLARFARGPLPAAVCVWALQGIGGCNWTSERIAGQGDAATIEMAGADGGMVVDGREAVQHRGNDLDSCTPVTIQVTIAGSYQAIWPALGGDIHGPSVIAQHVVLSDPGLEARLHTWVTVPLASPHFAAAYSAKELCSTEEASPSYLRIACLTSGFNHSNENGEERDRPSIIEYRLERRRKLTIFVDGAVMPLSENESYNTPMPPGVCATLATSIPKRDLKPLQNSYENNSGSDRCRGSVAPRRKVRAKLIHVALPKGHELYEMGILRKMSKPPYRSCRSVTRVQLSLPRPSALSQELGLLGAQCDESCDVTRNEHPNAIGASCGEGGKVYAYQLGDNLYVVDDDHVRQVQLPCGVDLAFDTIDFAAQLGWH